MMKDLFIQVFIYLSILYCLYLLGLKMYPNNRPIIDYQINIHNDTIWLYDGSRLVGRVLNKWNSPLDSLILKDNN